MNAGPTERTSGESPAPATSSRLAWGVCWLMFASTMLNYVDRQAITLVRPQIQAEYHINYETFGWVLAAFSLVYALMQVPAGFLADRLDPRPLYASAVVWWSLAAMAAAFSPTLGALIACRAMLGVGESFNWPCALRVTSQILPARDRGLGNGIFNSGAAIGAVVTPMAVPLLAGWLGWRSAFVIVGSLGLLWVSIWLVVMRGSGVSRLALHGRQRPVGTEHQAPHAVALAAFALLAATSLAVGYFAYRAYERPAIWIGVAMFMVGLPVLARMLPLSALGQSNWASDLGRVSRRRRFWILVVVTISINICWHFLVSWLPSYLREDRELSALLPGARSVSSWLRYRFGWHLRLEPADLVAASVTAVIFIAADVGNLLGGMGSRMLGNRGMTPARARLHVLVGSVVLISGGAWLGVVRNDWTAIALLSGMALGAAAFMANYFAFCQEVDARHTGMIVGLLGGLGNLFAAGILPFAGWVKDRYGSFAPIFMIVGISPLLGLLALRMGWGEALEETFEESH